jgi:hypothetical protein
MKAKNTRPESLEYLSPRRKARKGTVSDSLGDLGGFARKKFDQDRGLVFDAGRHVHSHPSSHAALHAGAERFAASGA